MRVLIVGGGGREHALAWKCAQSQRVQHVYVAPGNAGTALEPKVSNVGIAAEDIDALLAFAIREDIELTIVGPEGPLVAGIVDRFAAAARRCFGPLSAAARLEGSKAFTKEFLSRHRIPTASFATFTAADFDADYVRAQRLPLVVKADGLAAGKGVVICETHESAIATATAMLGGSFGTAGRTIVIEEFLTGEEVSFIVVASDSQVLALATSQDHKRRDDGDLGPNTGGMGAYSPAPIVSAELHQRIMREVIEPTLSGLRRDGNPYTGFLYAGLMIADDGTPNVLEFNCRFGDPEAQPILMRLQSDLPSLCEAALDGTLSGYEVRWDARAALGVVMAAGGYPNTFRTGDPISGLDAAAGLPGKIFHAGTRTNDGQIVTAGGRVLCAVGLGDSVGAAQQQAYALVHAIHWNLVQYRLDIGYRAIERERALK
ncbi:MAG TPA: phosphoribosylamine--glycine ligase [Steroidobacteraceae bacterium]|jgi:phosphoribosylamine--glycine ligase|nr:phosphoribosylamine--glycine ligase [Steroidobacteraceae bacterium]